MDIVKTRIQNKIEDEYLIDYLSSIFERKIIAKFCIESV